MQKVGEIARVAGPDQESDRRRKAEDGEKESRGPGSHVAGIGHVQPFLSFSPSPATCWQNGRIVKTKVEELPESRVRLEVEVPSDHVKHAVEHASSDLAASTKIPGFRKGKVPQKVLEARVGRDKIFSEAVESHIGGWVWNAAEDASIRPRSQAELHYRLPRSENETFNFIR